MNHSASAAIRPAVGEVGAAHDPDHTVGAQARVPIGQPPDGSRVEVGVQRAVEIGQQHEVVLRAVPLDEGEAPLHGRRS